jgi:hypothetical protein
MAIVHEDEDWTPPGRRGRIPSKVWKLVGLITAQSSEEHRLPPEQFTTALCELFPTTADMATMLEQLPDALRERDDLVREMDFYDAQRRQREEWATLKPAREAAWETYRRAAALAGIHFIERPELIRLDRGDRVDQGNLDDELPF